MPFDLTTVISSTVVAAIIAGIFLLFSKTAEAKNQRILEIIRTNQQVNSYILEDTYKRERDIYTRLWKIVVQVKHIITLDKQDDDAEKEFGSLWGLSSSRTEPLLKRMEEMFEELEYNRPFLPKELVDICDEFAEIAVSWWGDRMTPSLTKYVMEKKSAVDIRDIEINALSQELERIIRRRTRALEGQSSL